MASVISDNITSPLGLTTEQTYKSVCEGKSGLKHYPCEDGKGGWNDLPFPIEASLFSKEQWDEIMVDGFSKFESLVLHSVKAAISTLVFNKERAILILSSTKGDIDELSSLNANHSTLNSQTNTQHPSPSILADAAKKVSLAIGIENDPIVICNACISGVSALILGQRLVDCGNYTHVIVCGADVQGRFIVSGFQSLKALSDEPCRPFDIERLGLNLGEAAATIVLSSEFNHPDGWKIDKGAVCNDAYHISAPHPKGLGAGLALGKVKDKPISVIGVHGTATMYNDQMESKAIEMAGLQDVPLSALKGYFGHTMGAAGVLETIIMMRALEDGVILPSKGFETCGVSGKVKMSDKPMTAEGNTFVKMLSGFGGCNGAVRVSDRTFSQIIVNDILIKQPHSVKITQEEIVVDGERLDLKSRGKEMLTEVYKTKIGDYPKFYKMDMLSRLAFIASELLIESEGQRAINNYQLTINMPNTQRAVVLFNYSSSIIADCQYMKSIEKDDFFPSPAAFVYTLPNITTGEIALRNGYHGETSFYLLAEKNEKLMQRVIKSTFIDRDIKSVIGGWIDCPSEDEFECEIKIFDKE